MIDMLKYLLLSFAALLLFEGASETSYADNGNIGERKVEITTQRLSIAQQGVCLTTTSQLSSASTLRLQSNGRKQESNHRNSYECVKKSGKRGYFSTRYIVRERSLIHNSMLMEPTDILAKFCKLII